MLKIDTFGCTICKCKHVVVTMHKGLSKCKRPARLEADGRFSLCGAGIV